MTDLSDLRRTTAVCHEAVVCKGEEQPCDKPAVAARRCEGLPYPVCAYHARGPEMVPLRELLEVSE